MILFCVGFLFLGLSSTVQAATYYVDATNGLDANNGTSTGTAWKTINKVNASTFLAGDQIQFKKGEVWYETLIVSSSGSIGSPITFSSYGTATDKPIISGAIDASTFSVGTPNEVFGNNTFETGDLTNWTTVVGTGGTVAESNEQAHSGTYSVKMVRSGANNKLRQAVTLAANTYYNISFWYYRSSGSSSSPIMWMYDTTSNYLQNDLSTWKMTANLIGGTNAYVATTWTQVSFNFKTGNTTSYTIEMFHGNDSVAYLDDFSLKPIQWEQVSGNEYKANIYNNINTNSTVNYFTNDYARTGPPMYNSSKLNTGTALSLVSDQGAWDSTNKTMNVNVGQSPIGLDIKIPWRTANIKGVGKNYIAISNLDLRQTATTSTNLDGAISVEDSACSNWIISNNNISFHSFGGINKDSTAGHDSWNISGNSITGIWNGSVYGNGGSGYAIYIGGNSNIVTKNIISDSYTGINVGGLGSQTTYNILSNIYVNGINHTGDSASNSVMIYNNTVYHNVPASWTGGHGIDAQESGHGTKIKNNAVYSVGGAGSSNIQALAISESNTIEVNNNVLYSQGTSNVCQLGYTGIISSPNSPTAPAGCSYVGNTLYCSTFLGCQSALASSIIKDNNTLKWTNDGTVGNAGMTSGSGDDPSFVTLGSSFQIISTSPAIDAATDVGLTTDYAGNPIYGTPDIGAYEYQPPYIIGTDEVNVSAEVRVYADGKFRNIGTAGGTTADLTITPSSGSFTSDTSAWMDVTDITWNTTGDYSKQWTESSTFSGLTNTVHTIGDLEANTYYNITVDSSTTNLSGTNCNIAGSSYTCLSNSNGEITFTYLGTYSTHTFNVIEGDNTVPVISGVTSTPTSTGATITWTTDEVSSSLVEYGLTSSYGTSTTEADTGTRVTGHSVLLSNLSTCTRYYYRVHSKDATSNESIVVGNSFLTTECGGGGLPSGAYALPITPTGGFKVLVNSNAETTNSPNVTLSLTAGADVKNMAISNFSDFRDASQEPYQPTKQWDLCQQRTTCPAGQYTVYVKFYTQYGQVSETVQDTINKTTTPTTQTTPTMSADQRATLIVQIKQQLISLITQLIQMLYLEVEQMRK